MNVIEKLQALIQIPSESSHEEAIAQWLFRYLKDAGVQPEQKENNVFCRIPGKNQTKAIIFNGHTDTVSAGTLSEWGYPPVGADAGVVTDGRVYGLGASDMKASLAAFLELVDRYRDEVPPLDLFFSFVREEETTGRGSREYVQYFQENWQSRYEDVICIVGEPTGFEYIELGNRGVHHVELVIEGVACHASQAAGKTTNAPELAFEAMSRIEELKKEWGKSFVHEQLGKPAVTMTGIRSSESSVNSVPSSVLLRWDIRTTPELHPQVKSLMEDALGDLGKVVGLRDPCQCAFCPIDSSLVRAFEAAHPAVEHRIARGGNDCGSFIEVGIPAVTFGPGKKEVIHQMDEYAPVQELERACEEYDKVIQAFASCR